jgi:hypothetical protein
MRAPQLLLAAAIVGFNAPSLAAPAIPVAAFQINSGTGSINSGRGFRPVNATMGVAAGDSVIVAPGGSAEIVYFDDCRIRVSPGQVVVVTPTSPCARGQARAPADIPRKGETKDNKDNDSYSSYYLLGGAAAVGAGVGIWAAMKHSSPSPASP